RARCALPFGLSRIHAPAPPLAAVSYLNSYVPLCMIWLASSGESPALSYSRICFAPHALPVAGVKLSVAVPVFVALALAAIRIPVNGVLPTSMLDVNVYDVAEPPSEAEPHVSSRHLATVAIMERMPSLMVLGGLFSAALIALSAEPLLSAVIDQTYT